jgi:hypothetical protein
MYHELPQRVTLSTNLKYSALIRSSVAVALSLDITTLAAAFLLNTRPIHRRGTSPGLASRVQSSAIVRYSLHCSMVYAGTYILSQRHLHSHILVWLTILFNCKRGDVIEIINLAKQVPFCRDKEWGK